MSPIRGRRTLHDSDRVSVDNTEDPLYKEKRSRNNHAVKKSREKAKEKTREMEKKVEVLKKENDSLQTKINVLQGELERLKNTFISHADTTHGVDIKVDELDSVLDDIEPTNLSETVQRLIDKVEGPAKTSLSSW